MSPPVDPDSVCGELPPTRKRQITVDTETIDERNGRPCTLILRIGKSEFVEIKGIIRPACQPSTHSR